MKSQVLHAGWCKYIWWDSRGNLKLITLGCERVNATKRHESFSAFHIPIKLEVSRLNALHEGVRPWSSPHMRVPPGKLSLHSKCRIQRNNHPLRIGPTLRICFFLKGVCGLPHLPCSHHDSPFPCSPLFLPRTSPALPCRCISRGNPMNSGHSGKKSCY